jgi:hypothetical protein
MQSQLKKKKKKKKLIKLMDDITISCPTLERTIEVEEYFCPEILLVRSFFAHNIMA